MADAADFAELPRRSGATLAFRRWRRRSRFHLVGVATILRRVQPRASVLGRQVLSLPVRDAGSRSAGGAARRYERRGYVAADPRHLGPSHRSLQRTARGIAAQRARHPEDRDELHRRLIMTFTHLDSDRHPAMVDVSD